MEPLSLKERNSTAALYGLLTGVANMLLITVAYTQVNNSMVMNGITMAGGALSLTLVGVLTAQIKKKNGGYLPFKETYGSIIIIMMVSTLLYVAYNYVYMMFIDPDFGLKIKAAVLRAMEQAHVPQSTLDSMTAKMDEQLSKSKTFNLWNNVVAYFTALLLNCAMGVVVAFIVRKEEPMFKQ